MVGEVDGAVEGPADAGADELGLVEGPGLGDELAVVLGDGLGVGLGVGLGDGVRTGNAGVAAT